MVEAEGSVPALLVGDMVRVKQILVNIIGNAVKFTQEGYVRLSVQAEEEKRNPLTMKVEDTGVGIKKTGYWEALCQLQSGGYPL